MPTLEQIQEKMKKLQVQADTLIAKKAQAAVDQIRKIMLTHGLTTEDIEHLHTGYAGLLSLMERIPTRWAWAAEPPHVFRADE